MLRSEKCSHWGQLQTCIYQKKEKVSSTEKEKHYHIVTKQIQLSSGVSSMEKRILIENGRKPVSQATSGRKFGQFTTRQTTVIRCSSNLHLLSNYSVQNSAHHAIFSPCIHRNINSKSVANSGLKPRISNRKYTTDAIQVQHFYLQYIHVSISTAMKV